MSEEIGDILSVIRGRKCSILNSCSYEIYLRGREGECHKKCLLRLSTWCAAADYGSY